MTTTDRPRPTATRPPHREDQRMTATDHHHATDPDVVDADVARARARLRVAQRQQVARDVGVAGLVAVAELVVAEHALSTALAR